VKSPCSWLNHIFFFPCLKSQFLASEIPLYKFLLKSQCSYHFYQWCPPDLPGSPSCLAKTARWRLFASETTCTREGWTSGKPKANFEWYIEKILIIITNNNKWYIDGILVVYWWLINHILVLRCENHGILGGPGRQRPPCSISTEEQSPGDVTELGRLGRQIIQFIWQDRYYLRSSRRDY